MRTHLNTFPLVMALALAACAPADTAGTDGPAPGPGASAAEDDTLARRSVFGDLGSDEAALAGTGTLDAATQVRVVSLDDDGTRTVHGEAAVSASGRFEVAADGMTRTFIVEAVDASGEVVGAAVVTADASGSDAIDAGTLTLETAVEAMVWAEIVHDDAVASVSSAEVRARVDAQVAAAADAWADDHDGALVAFDAVAEAALAATLARDDAASEVDTMSAAEIHAHLRTWVEGVEDAAGLAVAVDAALAARGMTEVERAATHARTEAAFRAALSATLLAEGDAAGVTDAGARSSGQLEAWAHLEAFAALGDKLADAGAEAEVLASIEALLVDAAEDGEAGEALWTSLDLSLDASVALLVEGLLDDDGGFLGLGAVLGLSVTSEAQAEEAMSEWASELRAEAQARIDAAVIAAADDGDDVAEATAEATADVWAELQVGIDAVLEAASESENSEVDAALHLMVGAFLRAD